MSAAAAVAPPSERQRALSQEDFDNAEPPPAYTPYADATERPVEYGPARPFEQATVQPFSAPAPAPPTLPARPPQPSVVGSPQASTGVYSPFAPLQPLPHQSRPELEWEYGNGYDSDSRQTPQHRPPTSQPPQPNPRPTSGSSNANPNTNNSGTTSWEPTQRPVGGQPLLNANRILIFPDTNHIECTKCHDTGYKAYDPNTPCSRCWSKYGQPFSSARRIALRSTIPGGNSYPPNTQKPLPKQQRPSTQPQTQSTYIQPQQTGWQQHQPHYQPHPSLMPPPQHPPPQHQPFFYGHPNVPPQGSLPPIVVRPGDPRIGGRLCPNCGGRGLVAAGFLLLDEDDCSWCGGSGRLFR